MNYKLIILFLYGCLSALLSYAYPECQAGKEDNVSINRYGMRLKKKMDGTYTIDKKYDTFPEVAGLPELVQPYVYTPRDIRECDYNGCITKQFIYKTYDGYQLALEVDIPEGKGPFPFIIYVHGGGWYNGTLDVFRKHSTYLASHGIAGVRISYTLIPRGATYNQVSAEINEAFSFIKSHAAELSLDMSNFGFAGGSAGAHLSAIAAMQTKGCKLFIGIFGSYDLLRRKPGNFPSEQTLQAYFNTKDADTLKKASAFYCIPDRNVPACLLVHGTCDTSIDYTQSIWFREALEKNGAFTELLLYKGYEHSFTRPGVSDAYESLVQKMLSFSKQIFARKRIASVGNSITYGALLTERKKAYPALLQQKSCGRFEVCNFGVPGATLQFDKKNAYVKSTEYKSIAAFCPEVILLKLGANDARPQEWNGRDVFYKNYAELLDSLLLLCPEIYLCTPTRPYGEKWKDRNKLLKKELIPVIRKIAKEKHLKLIDLYKVLPAEDAYYMKDGIHPTAAGYEVISEHIYTELEK